MGQLLYAQPASHHALAGHPSTAAAPVLIIFLAPLVVSVAIWIWQFVYFARRFNKPDNDGDGGGGAGGGGSGGEGPPRPPMPQPDLEPEWWPEFERQFQEHVKSREPRNAPQRVLT
jgi:hypothetical protein